MYRDAIAEAYLADEGECLTPLLPSASFGAEDARRVEQIATGLVEHIRKHRRPSGGLDSFLREYDLTSEEGIVLMCLAEALLRIPDAATADLLIRDKIAPAEWERHLGHSRSWLVNASTLGLMLTGRVVKLDTATPVGFSGYVERIVARSGEPVIRRALIHAMRIMGRQFVLGRTIEEAVSRAGDAGKKGYRHSFDMLGEGARSAADAARYFQSYADAIEVLGAGDRPDVPGISVKLSALHPRFEYVQRDRVISELVPRLHDLAALARDRDIALTVDAEEADRLDLTLDVFGAVFARLDEWEGFGLAVQAYQKRAPAVLDWLAEQSNSVRRRIPVRLVKGAYWDTEIKRAQEAGLSGYPVFTRKASTDVSYLACARRILHHADCFLPQFATHNAHTVAAILVMTGADRDTPKLDFEFQRLHGMGQPLYDAVSGPDGYDVPCRIYAPVGSHEDLLAYLVRRLLENGANSSFVNRLSDDALPVEEIIRDPVAAIAALDDKPHPAIPLPERLYGAERRNAPGLLLSDPAVLTPLCDEILTASGDERKGGPLINGALREGPTVAVHDPADGRRIVGHITHAEAGGIEDALRSAQAGAARWNSLGGSVRADILERVAGLYWTHRAQLMALCVREAGKTLADALSEVREAVDFLHYYAARARIEFAGPVGLVGPTGERNELELHGRGIFCCISPWNFPLAIFTGQVTAALATGNAVVAKPAEQTGLTAFRATQLLHEGGVPVEVLHLLPGDGEAVGTALVSDPRVSGVAFTGSTEVGWAINRALAARQGPIVPLIAETGGQNALIADSSALTEQLVDDVVRSAFNSAGQRCSALRVLFLQADSADRVIDMVSGAMAELRIGDPMDVSTDIGPVIDASALARLRAHRERMNRDALKLAETPTPAGLDGGNFFAPCMFAIDRLDLLEGEVFGPVLHVIRYEAGHLDKVCDAISRTGYGLTLGIHSRIEETARQIATRVRAGNVYVNRDMVGAVVGVQPFGGEGLSGTGPKAGGPRYLHRFATERTISTDTTAAGGNASLLSLGDAGISR